MNEELDNIREEKIHKADRVLKLFFRALKGESLSVKALADETKVSPRSITRDINDLKAFLDDYRGILPNAELKYSSADHCYTLEMDNLFSNRELFALSKILIGSRALNKDELLGIISKLKSHTSCSDKKRLEELIAKEILHYSEVGSDCESVIENVWNISSYIQDKKVITIKYYKMNRDLVKHKIKPLSIMFSEYYFYLIAYKCDEEIPNTPVYFRIDRISEITVHRENYSLPKNKEFNEGLLRKRSQFMWPGPLRTIRFEFTGPSVQAILDRLPTARLIDKYDGKSLIEAEVYGDGIKMFLLSQGSWVKVVGPPAFVQEMKDEIEKMQALY